MSGLEAIAVIGAIAALVTAYKDAGDILAKLKLRRSKKEAQLPSSILEDTLSHAERTLKDQQHYHSSRYGDEWYDAKVVAELKELQLQFLKAVVQRMLIALEDDDFNDFGDLVNDSHLRALEAVESILGGIRRRIPVLAAATPPLSPRDSPEPDSQVEQASRMQRSSAFTGLSRCTSGTQCVADISTFASRQDTSHQCSIARESTGSSIKDNPVAGVVPTSRTFPYAPEDKPEFPERLLNKPRSSIYQRKHGRALPPIRKASAPPSSFPKLPIAELSRRRSTPATLFEHGWNHRQGIEDVWDATSIWRNNEHSTSSDPMTPPAEPSLYILEETGDKSDSEIIIPRPENGLLGMCKGAVGLQNGCASAMQTSNHVLYLNPVPYDHCSTCGFLRWLDRTSVNIFLPGRLQYRWTFLAKCHVPIAGKRHNEEYGYKCLICAMSGRKTLPTIIGADWLLMHVALEHHDERMDANLVASTGCIWNRMADSTDMSWDINLVPEVNGLDLRARYAAAKDLAEHQSMPTDVSYLPSLKWFRKHVR